MIDDTPTGVRVAKACRAAFDEGSGFEVRCSTTGATAHEKAGIAGLRIYDVRGPDDPKVADGARRLGAFVGAWARSIGAVALAELTPPMAIPLRRPAAAVEIFWDGAAVTLEGGLVKPPAGEVVEGETDGRWLVV